MPSATAIAHPNIALVKYWGKRDAALNLPATSSLSLTLGAFRTRVSVDWDAACDEVIINGEAVEGPPSQRVLRFLDLVDADRPPCRVVTENDFPTAAGLASSSSAFAALALAATTAAGRKLDPVALSVLARRGSGSACRSIFGGWVLWPAGTRPDGADSHGVPLASPDHWDVRMVVALAETGAKAVGSTDGMLRTQRTSPFWEAWAASSARDLEEARAAVLARDLPAVCRVMERSAFRMHATMLSADPPIRYWKPATLSALEVTDGLKRNGIEVGVTMDAGPNVKVLCASSDAPLVADALRAVVGTVEIAAPGGPARLVDEE